MTILARPRCPTISEAEARLKLGVRVRYIAPPDAKREGWIVSYWSHGGYCARFVHTPQDATCVYLAACEEAAR